MTPSRPYLIRAIYEWIVDNDMTPHVIVDARIGEAELPQEYIQDQQIVLNLSPRAVQSLDLGNDRVVCQARFGGQPRRLDFPVHAVVAIYARENGQGMLFSDDEPDPVPPPDHESTDPPQDKGARKRPNLKVIK